jgi:hypothetical protein
MIELYSTNKWYVDGQLPNHMEIAKSVAGQFPHLRLAIGPTKLNVGYKGTDKPQIESFVQSIGGLKAPNAGLRAPTADLKESVANTPSSDASIQINVGDMVLVTMPGIGEIVATFVRMQGTNAVVDLDGIEEVVDFSALAPVPPEDSKTPSVPPTVPPEPPALPVEAKSPSIPPEAAVFSADAIASNEPLAEFDAPSAEEK